MGKIKEYILLLAQLVEEYYEDGVEEREIDQYIQEDLDGDQYNFYIENRDFILQMANIMANNDPKYDIKDVENEDDEEWTDPAGGSHYGNEEDPARMYESYDIIHSPSLYDLI